MSKPESVSEQSACTALLDGGCANGEALFGWLSLLGQLEKWDSEREALDVDLQRDWLFAPSVASVRAARKWIDAESLRPSSEVPKGVLMTGDGGLAFWYDWNRRIREFDCVGTECFMNLKPGLYREVHESYKKKSGRASIGYI